MVLLYLEPKPYGSEPIKSIWQFLVGCLKSTQKTTWTKKKRCRFLQRFRWKNSEKIILRLSKKKTENMCYLGIAEPHVCRVIIKKNQRWEGNENNGKKTTWTKKNYMNFSAILKATSKCRIQSVLCAKHTYKYNKVIW